MRNITFPPVITHVDLNFSDNCNLNCDFCYTRGGHCQPYSQQHIDKCFEWIFSQFTRASPEQKTKGIRISIYGGEPLVEFNNIKYIVPWVKAQGKANGFPIGFGIVTNMTLLDEEKLTWLCNNNIGIHPSIDGCAPAQDACRVFKNGKGSSSIVYENARRLINKLPGRSVRMTISPRTAEYLYDSIVFLCKDIGFKTANAILAGGVEWSDSDLDKVKEQIIKITDWWIDEMRKGNHYSLYHIRNMLSGIWNPRRKRNLCSAGANHIGIDTKGSIWPCHRFNNFASTQEYLLGTIETGYTNRAFFDRLMSYDLAAENKERCKNCIAVNSCHALCLHEMMVANCGMFTPLDHYCKIWPFYYQQAMKAHSILMAENNRFYEQMYAPKPNMSQQRNHRNHKII